MIKTGIVLMAFFGLLGCTSTLTPSKPFLDFCDVYTPDYNDSPSEADLRNNAIFIELCVPVP